MRISDWSSDVCSSDLIEYPAPLAAEDIRRLGFAQPPEAYDPFRLALVLDVVLDWDAEANETSDKARKSVVKGKSVSVRVDLGGRRRIKKKNYNQTFTSTLSI